VNSSPRELDVDQVKNLVLVADRMSKTLGWEVGGHLESFMFGVFCEYSKCVFDSGDWTNDECDGFGRLYILSLILLKAAFEDDRSWLDNFDDDLFVSQINLLLKNMNN